MNGITDFTKEKNFWSMISSEAPAAKETFTKFWKEVETTTLNKDDACACLDALFIDSHARILQALGATSKSLYPTTKRSKDRLQAVEHMWWVDHFTAGISHASTLNWFGTSSAGKASTHFVIGYHTDPFYIIPLMHGAWHTPARNADSWSVEMVNAGPIRSQGDDWAMWNNRILPQKLVKELPPQPVSPPYKGAHYFQPFTTDQVIANMKLKRLIRWATEDKLLSEARMSQHSQWQEGKFDMGPLWPFDEVNTAVFEDYPLEELVSYQQAIEAVFLPSNENKCESEFDDHDTCPDNPEYGISTDLDKDIENPTTAKDIQQLLINRGYSIKADGIYGPATKEAVKNFQRRCNDNNPSELLVVDGIVGPLTLEKLKR